MAGVAPGQYVMRWETEQLSNTVVDIFGYYALQLGFLELDALAANRMPHRLRVTTRSPAISAGAPKADLAGQRIRRTAAGLAVGRPGGAGAPAGIQPGSAPDPARGRSGVTAGGQAGGGRHESPLALGPAAVGRPAADRTVPPAYRTIYRHTATAGLDETAQLRNRQRPLWLLRATMPYESSGWSACVSWRRAGDRWWPICGAVYMVSAVKRVRGMRLVGPAWKRATGTESRTRGCRQRACR